MDERNRLLIDSIPEKFFFEDHFKKNGTHIIRAKANLPDSGKLLSRKDEFVLFRKYNYYRYRIVSTVAGRDWREVMGNKEEMGRRALALSEEKLRIAEGFVESAAQVRNIILNSNTRLMFKPIFRYEQTDSNRREELVSNSYLHIIKAINGFDYRRGFKFSTYCVGALKNNLCRDFYVDSKRRSRVWGDMEEMEAECAPEGSRSYDLGFISGALASLDEMQRRIVMETFGIDSEKKDMKKISMEMGIPRCAVKRIKDKAIKAMSRMRYDPVF